MAFAGVTSASIASARSGVSLPCSTRLPRDFPIFATARSTAPGAESHTATGTPAIANAWAMPVPIEPVPTTAALRTSVGAAPPRSGVFAVPRVAKNT